MKPKFGENLKLCYMDTASLVYHIKTKDIYEDIAKDVETRFDTSGYKKEDARPLPIGLNKKDELEGKIMTEFVALRPKLYTYRKLDDKKCEGIKKCVVKEDKRCKGIKKCVVEKTLGFDDYKKCLFDPGKSKNIYRPQLMFRNKKHKVHTVEVNKVALNRDDDKRIAKKDRISKLARGHNSLCWNSLLVEVSLS